MTELVDKQNAAGEGAFLMRITEDESSNTYVGSNRAYSRTKSSSLRKGLPRAGRIRMRGSINGEP